MLFVSYARRFKVLRAFKSFFNLLNWVKGSDLHRAQSEG